MQTISTGDVPARERLSYLHDYVSSRIAGLNFTPRDPDCFDYRLTTESLGGATLIARTRYSAVRGARARLLGDGRSNYVLSIHDTDYDVEVGGRSWTVQAGDIMVVDESEAYAFSLPGTGSRIVSLDRARVMKAAPSIASRAAHHFNANSPRTALLSGYIDLLLNTARDNDGELLESHLYGLVASMLAASSKGLEPPRQSVADARLSLIRSDIETRLADADLTITAVAARQRLTPRYIQHLFAGEGTSFSDFVRDRRLEQALLRLRDDCQMKTAIAAIAFDCGFGDLSSFNRAFRKRYGITPSEIRAQTLSRSRTLQA